MFIWLHWYFKHSDFFEDLLIYWLLSPLTPFSIFLQEYFWGAALENNQLPATDCLYWEDTEDLSGGLNASVSASVSHKENNKLPVLEIIDWNGIPKLDSTLSSFTLGVLANPQFSRRGRNLRVRFLGQSWKMKEMEIEPQNTIINLRIKVQSSCWCD